MMIYILLIPVFAHIYWVSYNENKLCFFINSDVDKQQIEINKRYLIDKIEILKNYNIDSLKKINALKELSDFLSSKNGLVKKTLIGNRRPYLEIQYGEYLCRFYFTSPGPKGSPEPYMKIERDGKHIYSALLTFWGFFTYANLPDKFEDYYKISVSFLKEERKIYDSQVKELEKTKSDLIGFEKDRRDVRSYFDFLYFSTITQTTVGYGDILPNSTEIRILVMIQILLGLLIVSFIINFVVSGGNNTTRIDGKKNGDAS